MSPARAIQRYHSGALPFAVDVYLHTYEGPPWVRSKLRGRSGWLQLSRAMMVTPISSWRTTLIAARTDDGEPLNKLVSSAFLAMRSSGPRELGMVPPEEIDTQSEMLMWDFLGTCDLRHLRMLSEAEAERDTRVASEQARGEEVLAQVDAYIAELRRQRRALDAGDQRRASLAETISFFEEKQSAAAAWLVRRLAGIRDEVVALEADVMEALEHHGEIEELYTVRWTARHPADRVYSGERPDSFFLGPNPPRRRNRTAEARLAEDRRFDDESFDDRRSRLALARNERRLEWLARLEENRRQEVDRQAKRDAASAEFAKWASQHLLEQQRLVDAEAEAEAAARRRRRRAARLEAVEVARERKRALRRQQRSASSPPDPLQEADAAIDESARQTMELGTAKSPRSDLEEFHDWMKEVGLT